MIVEFDMAFDSVVFGFIGFNEVSSLT